MQRPYTKFPTGFPGIGLLLLRSVIGVRLIIEGSACLRDSQTLHLGVSLFGLLTLGAGVSFVLGFLTPLAAGAAVLAGTAVWLWHPAWASSFVDLQNLNTIAITVAILLLGPGAISSDAHIFGRRKIIIPRAG